MSDEDLDLRDFFPRFFEGEFHSRSSMVAMPVVIRPLHLKSPIGHVHDVLPLVGVGDARVAKANLLRHRVARLANLDCMSAPGQQQATKTTRKMVNDLLSILPAAPRGSTAAAAP
jgi:hypothetical protein